MSYFDLCLPACTPRYGWQELLDFTSWKAVGGGSKPTDTYLRESDCHVLCSRVRACEVRGWDDLKVHGAYGGTDTAACACLDNVFVSQSVCVTVQECFPICFLCVFDRDERALCSHVCWQKVRHSRTRPQLVPFGVICCFSSTSLYLVFFSFPFLSPSLTLSKSGNRECLFLFYMLYLFIYISVLHSCMPCLILHWFFDRGEIVRTAPWLRPVWSSLFANPAQDSQRRLQALFFLVSEQISGKWKQMKKAAAFCRMERRERGIFTLVKLVFRTVEVPELLLSVRSCRCSKCQIKLFFRLCDKANCL